MLPGTLVFCERSGRWAVAWRRLWARDFHGGRGANSIRVVETRSVSECLETLAEMPAAFVAIELTAKSADKALELLVELITRFRDSAAAALAENELADYEWLAREIGAVHFVSSPRQLPSMVDVVRRHAERTPEPELELRQEIWARLPWGD
jgi:DNA-binding NtrC family response regulator